MKAAAPTESFARQARLFRRLAIILAALLLAVLVIPPGARWINEHAIDLGLTQISPQAPQHAAVRTLMRPLRYSGLPVIMQPDVRLSLDLRHRRWTFHNAHRFDAQGQIILPHDRYGICGDLSAYVYPRVRALLPQEYAIEFARVSESAFFPSPIASHYVLQITPMRPGEPPQPYILDPSFHRYGPLDDFEDYLFHETLPELTFMRSRNPDETYPAGYGMPLILHSKAMLGLVVAREHRRFDRDHYRVSLVATFRHRYASRNLLTIRRREGRVEVIENAALARQLFSAVDYARLRQRFFELVQGMTVTDAEAVQSN